MNHPVGLSWQGCLWASPGCYSLFYVLTNVVIERYVGWLRPPGSGLPAFVLGYLVVVVAVGYWVLLGYLGEFAAHPPGQAAVTLAAGAMAGGSLVYFIPAANRAGADAGADAGRQARIIGLLSLSPVPALDTLFALDALREGANVRHAAMRMLGASLLWRAAFCSPSTPSREGPMAADRIDIVG
jgi:hypothetical protein